MGMIRIVIPFAAILIGLVALAARSDAPGALTAPSAPAAVPTAETGSEPFVTSSSPLHESDGSVPESGPVPPPASAKPVLEPHVQNRPLMVVLLERELSLSEDQRRHVEAVLTRREEEIDGHHRQLRAVGAVSGEAYHRHMQELRAHSYLQIGQVLDTEQHRRFVIIVAQGALNDVIGFPLDEGMVSLD